MLHRQEGGEQVVLRHQGYSLVGPTVPVRRPGGLQTLLVTRLLTLAHADATINTLTVTEWTLESTCARREIT